MANETYLANETGKGVACFGFKTSVAASSLDCSVSNAFADVVCCEFGSEKFRKYIPEQHMEQKIQQMYVVGTNYCVYVSASETGLLLRCNHKVHPVNGCV